MFINFVLTVVCVLFFEIFSVPKTGSNFCVVPVPDTDPNWNGVAAGVEAPKTFDEDKGVEVKAEGCVVVFPNKKLDPVLF